MPVVTLYTRAECHLCDAAFATLQELRREMRFTLEICDIDAEPGLTQRYGDTVPVVAIDGVAVAQAPFEAAELRDALASALATARR